MCVPLTQRCVTVAQRCVPIAQACVPVAQKCVPVALKCVLVAQKCVPVAQKCVPVALKYVCMYVDAYHRQDSPAGVGSYELPHNTSFRLCVWYSSHNLIRVRGKVSHCKGFHQQLPLCRPLYGSTRRWSLAFAITSPRIHCRMIPTFPDVGPLPAPGCAASRPSPTRLQSLGIAAKRVGTLSPSPALGWSIQMSGDGSGVGAIWGTVRLLPLHPEILFYSSPQGDTCSGLRTRGFTHVDMHKGPAQGVTL